ncbi:VQ motif-containing protein 17-like [Prosopis cineraria]|uniref:VQ motif-containing protein 17-like n=1 Tax=Prosopis cineraria TaxID=364024 RepID=UPI00240F65BF|nr:VQ motif-containing protein 17-like [Prosopis cineraria]
MENGVKGETSIVNGAGGGHLGMHKHSQTISKMKPKIRIIHIFAPEIIQTDVHNFRKLVQRLTGKPTAIQNYSRKTKQETRVSESRDVADPVKMELTDGFLGFDQSTERLIKEEQGFYNSEISSGGYLRGLEGFISEFGNFPFSPNSDAAHRHAQEFEDALFS